MTYVLGIDIGITSIGFSGISKDTEKILFCGSHIFEAAEDPKDGSSLAAPRREKRGQRRVINRRAKRKKAIRRLLAKHGFKDIALIDAKTSKGNTTPSPWELRKQALERKLSDGEFARVLFHIAKRRGFQSNKKGDIDKNDTEGQNVLTGAVKLEERWLKSGEKTIAAYLSTQAKQRNGDGDYTNSIKRDAIREEVRLIFKSQQKFGNEKATNELLYEYAGSGKKEERNTREGDGIAFYQRPLQSSEHLVGFCKFEPEHKRAPKHSYTAELFVLWTKINNCRIRDSKGNERALTPDERHRLAELAHKNKGGVTYKQARNELGLSDDERFNISYRKIKDSDNSWDKIRNQAEKSYFLKLTGYHALKEALDTGSATDWQNWIHNRRADLDDIARILSFYEDKKQVDEMLSKHGLSEEQKEKLCNIKISKSVDLSLKAITNILPHMQSGMRYDEACKEVYGDHRAKKENKGLNLVPKFEDIRNPVVNRALAQTRKVINACIRKYGMPDTIIVEMAREIGKPKKGYKSKTTGKWIQGRDDIEKEQKKNEAYRNEARKHAAEILGIIEDNVTGTDILKYRLLQEQNHFCPYCGSKITIDQFRDGSAVQIDHIIPYSRSWNDSYMNKVLSHTDCNQEKGNQTPYEWLGGTKRWDGVIVMAEKLPPKKKENLLIEEFDERKSDKWKDRALNDTRYIARKLKNHLSDNLTCKIEVRNGALTSKLRYLWGLGDKDRANDRHHAMDAIIIACSTQSMVQNIANEYKYNKKARQYPKPWETFREDAIKAVNNIFVSRMPVRKVTGSAHQDTIYSKRKIKLIDKKGKEIESSIAVSRKKLKDLIDPKKNGKELYNHLLKKIENIHNKENRAKGIYEAIKERIETYQKENKDPKTVFDTPIFMKASKKAIKKGRIHGEQIKHVRLNEGFTTGLDIYKGDIARPETGEKLGAIAPNTQGSMIRTDVFKKDNKYYLCPVYTHQIREGKGKLPNKVITGKEEKDWKEIDESFVFMFSMHKNDLIHIIKNDETNILGYFVNTDRSDARITLRAHDNDPSFSKSSKEPQGTTRVTTKTGIITFEKYSVDYFGNKTRIKKEKRVGVAQRNDSKSCQA